MKVQPDDQSHGLGIRKSFLQNKNDEKFGRFLVKARLSFPKMFFVEKCAFYASISARVIFGRCVFAQHAVYCRRLSTAWSTRTRIRGSVVPKTGGERIRNSCNQHRLYLKYVYVRSIHFVFFVFCVSVFGVAIFVALALFVGVQTFAMKIPFLLFNGASKWYHNLCCRAAFSASARLLPDCATQRRRARVLLRKQ